MDWSNLLSALTAALGNRKPGGMQAPMGIKPQTFPVGRNMMDEGMRGGQPAYNPPQDAPNQMSDGRMRGGQPAYNPPQDAPNQMSDDRMIMPGQNRMDTGGLTRMVQGPQPQPAAPPGGGMPASNNGAYPGGGMDQIDREDTRGLGRMVQPHPGLKMPIQPGGGLDRMVQGQPSGNWRDSIKAKVMEGLMRRKQQEQETRGGR